MTRRVKEFIIRSVTFLGGLYFFLEYLLPEDITGITPEKYGHIVKGIQVVTFMAIGLGIINIAQIYGGEIVRGQKGWFNALVLILGLLIMVTIEGINVINGEESNSDWQDISMLAKFAEQIVADVKEQKPTALSADERTKLLVLRLEQIIENVKSNQGYLRAPSASPVDSEDHQLLLSSLATAEQNARKLKEDLERSVEIATVERNAQSITEPLSTIVPIAKDFALRNLRQTRAGLASDFFNKAFFESLGSAMFALLAFYIASAAYRAFRIRSLEGLIMMLAALIVILGQIPQGPLYIWDGLPELRLRLMKNISTPSFRAIFFGSTIAGLAMAVRMWLSLETSPLGNPKDSSAEKKRR